MFDIGFWEILFIGVVALLVLGPERLPAVATMAGQWIARLRRFANHMRKEIRDELESEHLKQVLDEQNREMQSLRKEMTEVRRDAETAAKTDDIRREVEAAASTEDTRRKDADSQPGKQSSRDDKTDE